MLVENSIKDLVVPIKIDTRKSQSLTTVYTIWLGQSKLKQNDSRLSANEPNQDSIDCPFPAHLKLNQFRMVLTQTTLHH